MEPSSDTPTAKELGQQTFIYQHVRLIPEGVVKQKI